MNRTDHQELLDQVSGIFLRCFFFSFVVLLFWLCAYIFGADFIYRIHSGMIPLSRSSSDMFNYCGMGLVKLIAFMFFLFPYIAIRFAMRKKRV
jgi:hypothetical protein